ncbi:molybdate ABC transporter substrate-binding protein [Thermodesulfobacterium hydrogeniphilum]|uniref:molybdate ABC transporter substrate-binding protein n=1 Tax=Thermodesulfobacterium hydrogeniphilum TaxID=161156 RepID=UPI0005700546|nr:molybdate ABC transporter substrate-binding protein [Thermodesulfobacterium hydrogeniphilum]
MKNFLKIFLIIIGLFVFKNDSYAFFDFMKSNKQVLNLYVAASLKKPMDEVIQKFKEKYPDIEIRVNYGASGGLYTQIIQGQPCDLYFSADWRYVKRLENQGRLIKGEKFLTDKLVLVVSKTGRKKIKSINDLIKPGVILAVADPKAPVGVYAERALKKLGLWDKILAIGNLKTRPGTVNQVAIMVKEDQVDAGFIYKSVAYGYGLKPVQILPESITGQIVYGVGLIKGGNIKLAEKFYNFLCHNINIFNKYGWNKYENEKF